MREFYLTLDNCFKNGLRPLKSLPSSPNFMNYLLNGRVTEVGLEAYNPVVKTFNYTWDWPFPQLFSTEDSLLLGTSDEITIIDSGKIYEDTDEGLWDLLSFYDYKVACKGGDRIGIRDYSTGVWSEESSSTTFPIFKTCCNFRGQAIVGNLKEWPNSGDVNPNYVASSNIGEFNFVAGRKNIAMYRPLPWDEVIAVKASSDFIVAYGTSGIAGMYPADKYLALKDLVGPGIFCAGAVAASKNRQVYLGTDMRLRSIESQFAIKILDYREYMTQLSETVMISYREIEDEFFICDGVRSFVLRGDKLYECYQLVTSCGMVEDYTPAVYYDTALNYFLGVTDTIDFGYRAKKTIFTVELGIEGTGDFYVALDWRNSTKDSFTRTSYVPVNASGVATIITTGVDFRLCIKCSDYEDMKISSAIIRYKMTDLTTIRGIYNVPQKGME